MPARPLQSRDGGGSSRLRLPGSGFKRHAYGYLRAFGAIPRAFPSRATRRRAACRSQGPPPPATCWALPCAARLLRALLCSVRVGKVIARFARQRRPMRSRRRRSYVGHGVRIVVQGGWLPLAAAALHQLQQLLACPGVALGAPPALSRERPAAPGAALPAAPRDRRRPLSAGRSRTRLGFYVRCYAACAWGRSSRASRTGGVIDAKRRLSDAGSQERRRAHCG